MPKLHGRAVNEHARRHRGGPGPDRMSNSSSWPWPSSATMPSTSPAWRSNETSIRLRAAPRDRADRRGRHREPAPRRRSRGGGASSHAATAGPSMSFDDLLLRADPGAMSTTPTVLPSRRTVARSHSPATSSIRWEMKMTERDVPRWPAITSRTRAVRSAGSAAVISSRSRTSGSIASARARSTTRSVASGRSRACAQVELRDPQVGDPRAECVDRGLGEREVLGDVRSGMIAGSW